MEKNKLTKRKSAEYLAKATEEFLLADNPIDPNSLKNWSIRNDLIPQIHQRQPKVPRIAESLYCGKVRLVFREKRWDVAFLKPKLLTKNRDKKVDWLISELSIQAKEITNFVPKQ